MPHVPNLILSLFPGIDLFGRAFEAEGYFVVRGPDLLYAQDIASFTPAGDAFEGIIGGSPCQDFSVARRSPPTGEGLIMLGHFRRCVVQAGPLWWVLENVPGVPDVEVPGYRVQRFNLNANECGSRQHRLRRFQFGSREEGFSFLPLVRLSKPEKCSPCAMATEGTKVTRRSWPDFCELQGLPRNFQLESMSIKAKYKAVGNGVPLPMGRVVAAAIRRRRDTQDKRACVCECGRLVEGKQLHATASCRKRMQRQRDASKVTGPGPVTPAASRVSPAAA